MKKTIFTLIVCLACGLAYAEQATPVLSTSQWGCPVFTSYPQLKQLYINASTKQQVLVNIYNVDDFSLEQQINFPIQGTNSDSIVNSEMILNQFILVKCENTAATYEDNNRMSLKLYDIEGGLIYEFGEANSFWSLLHVDDDGNNPFVWQIAPNKLLFMIYRSINVDGKNNYTYEYYTLTFEPTESGTQNVQVEKKAAFPCPARGEVNIPTRGQQGDLRVLNINGQVLDAQRIQEGDYQRVNTESYPAGTYIYQAGNETGKFMVE